MSKCRQNYHDETEAGINKQINIELFAHYSYIAMVRKCVVYYNYLLSITINMKTQKDHLFG